MSKNRFFTKVTSHTLKCRIKKFAMFKKNMSFFVSYRYDKKAPFRVFFFNF